MTEYSLTDERDANGELKPVDHTFMFDGKERKIKLIPPTLSEVEDFEKMEEKEDPSVDELTSMFGEYIKEPDISQPTMKEAEAMAEGLLDYIGGGTDLAQAAQEELEARGSEGN